MPLVDEFEIPNLDAGTTPEEYAELAVHLERLSSYVQFKGFALRRRLEGQMSLAHSHEIRCDELFERLPESWRW